MIQPYEFDLRFAFISLPVFVQFIALRPAACYFSRMMRVRGDPQIISGLIFEEPVEEIPALTHCGEALCCRGHTIPPHAHSGFEFLFLARGCATWKISGTQFKQEMGQMFVAYPKELHSMGPNPETFQLWVGLDLEQMGCEGRRLASRIIKERRRLLTDCAEVEPLLRLMIRQAVVFRERRARVVRSLLQTLIALLAQNLAETSKISSAGWSTVLPYSYSIQKAVDYMKQHLERRISLRDLTAVTTLHSVSHLCTQFRREVGQSPAAFHLQLRLDAAREALRQPSCNITRAASDFGFSSSQHFSTVFRRTFKLTPRAWLLGMRR
jgi:AraC-like DNA-binding protein